MSVPLQAFLGICLLICAGVAVLSFSAWQQAWEYRLAEDTLEFRRPFDRGWATVQLDRTCAVYQVRGLESHEDWHEMVFRGGRRLLLERQVFGDFAKFQSEFRATRPEIRFDSRRGSQCPSCRRDLYQGDMGRAAYAAFVSRRCEMCGARLPGRLKRIPSGGMVLPDALERSDGS